MPLPRGPRLEVVGRLAVVDIPPGMETRAAEMARQVLGAHPRLDGVLGRLATPEGEARVPRLVPLVGSRTDTIHRENGCRFHVDLAHAFFSPRLAEERKRLASGLRRGQRVLCGFAGVGPFPIVLARLAGVHAVGVEQSPGAHRLLEENIRANHLTAKVEAVRGDIAGISPGRLFDHVVLTPPKEEPGGKLRYLDLGFSHLVPGGLLHYYTFAGSQEAASWRERGWSVRRCGDYAPGVHRVVVKIPT
ncbi:MAG: hypothetical protein HY558_01650 [Euryarchaeota archaeon]|nr:hypothetical protein [Euryarchaeota archaeon]